MENTPYVIAIPKGSHNTCSIPFESLDVGDMFFVNGTPHKVGIKAHISGDASYDGYLLYDDQNAGWFPEELDTEEYLILMSEIN